MKNGWPATLGVIIPLSTSKVFEASVQSHNVHLLVLILDVVL